MVAALESLRTPGLQGKRLRGATMQKLNKETNKQKNAVEDRDAPKTLLSWI